MRWPLKSQEDVIILANMYQLYVQQSILKNIHAGFGLIISTLGIAGFCCVNNDASFLICYTNKLA